MFKLSYLEITLARIIEILPCYRYATDIISLLEVLFMVHNGVRIWDPIIEQLTVLLFESKSDINKI